MEPRATLVVDTSSFLQELGTLQKVVGGAESARYEILVPQAVLQELDRIKDREKMHPLGLDARRAINFISDSLLHASDARNYAAVRGQSRRECGRAGLSGDEAILDCAEYNRAHTQRLTVLVARDINLLNRAIVEGLDTLNCGRLRSSADEIVALIERATEDVMWDSIGGAYDADADAEAEAEAEAGDADADADADVDADVDMVDYMYDDGLETEQPQTAAKTAAKTAARSSTMLVSKHATPPPPPPPPPNFAEFVPPPLPGTSLQDRLVSNISSLVDWHLRRVYGEDLAFLKYSRAHTSEQIARVLERFRMDFAEICGGHAVSEFLARVESRTLDRAYVRAHVMLLKALSGGSKEYLDILR